MLRARPTDYFNREEFERILRPTEKYEYEGGRDCACRARRVRLVLLMRWSGLSIKDAVMLERSALKPLPVEFDVTVTKLGQKQHVGGLLVYECEKNGHVFFVMARDVENTFE